MTAGAAGAPQVVVVGGGAAGLSLAHRLVETGAGAAYVPSLFCVKTNDAPSSVR
ncbi:hypothetical protein [Streptomyces sp. R02]|uniref:FAD-binding domain-containing protein n=1 Tax=Streptomyces sp. R02 TaxID=3238623 RepID=A0AB39LSZ5_9ACTN